MTSKKSNKQIVEGYDYLGKSASSQDCTGLIPSLPQNEGEIENYQQLYHFEPEVTEKKE